MEITVALANYPITAFKTLTEWKTHIYKWVKEAADAGAKLAVFPEYGSMELTAVLANEYQDKLEGQIEAMQELLADFLSCFEQASKTYDITLVAPSFPVWDTDRMVNRAFVFSANKGLVGYQDKWNMTRFENEEWNVARPKTRELSVFKCSWGCFAIQICYDVEFPSANAALAKAGADIVVAPSCTDSIRGASRVHIGARARAMEQQFFVAISQTCKDALWSPAVDINYGYTAIYSTADRVFPETGIVQMSEPNREGWLIQNLDLGLIQECRKNGQVLNYTDYSNEEVYLDIEVKEVEL